MAASIIAPEIVPERITGASAWRRDDLGTDNYLIPLTGECLDEIRRVAEELRQFPLPAIVRRPDDSSCRHVAPRCPK